VDELDPELFDRIFESAKSELSYDASGEWRDIFDVYQADGVKLIRDGKKNKLIKMLADPLSNNLQYGFDNLARVLQSKFRLETISEAATAADHFLALGEYTLATKYFSPECVSPFKQRVSIGKIINEILRTSFKGKIIFPNPYINEVGLNTEFGVASIRVPAAIYQALRMREFGLKICEIGPGLGRTAYFSKLLGVKQYTLVDLPIPSLCQAYFLGCSLPNENFTLNHESSNELNGFKFRQPETFMLESDHYDLILNVDSLTEMGIDVARTYLRNFVGKTNWFLSINHEGNEFLVREIAAELPEYKLISRNRSWIRQGYVEELYKLTTN
tara:strand:- start:905 stop:1891 length:987 start_codon:yes stop_codon:yes gene_type:complete